MIYIENQDIHDLSGFILNFPAFNKTPENLKNHLQEIFLEHMRKLYIERPEKISKFMKYNVDDEYAEIFLRQYNINRKYTKKLNKNIKKLLVYFLEKLFQKKGSMDTINIFGQIFENIFGAMNFYTVIVTKKETIVNNTKEYQIVYQHWNFSTC